MFDVRGHELTAVVSLNGANRTLALDVNATPETTPGKVATFQTNLTLTQQINTIEVRATDPNRRWAPDSPDANATTGEGRLLLDGDGLPDTYEENVIGTDPLNPDSNATQTARNESANNVRDGAEDLDNDGETVYEAYRFGLDPLANDTDGDRLLDGFELQFQGINPANNDTDNDSVSDAAEDLDNDTLSNLREQNASTNPVRADTDLDGLNDSEELANGTDSLAPDTDSDGLTDPDEYEVGTDPTVADTDGDGVLDGNETFSTETKNETVGAAVNISGKGNVADTVTIQNETNDQIQTETVSNASASAVLNFEADAEFEEANLSIDYDETQVENESALAVYTYDPKLQTYRKLPSEVDAENDSVTGTTPHFSTFVVLNKSEWQAYMESRAKPKPRFALNESFADLGGWNCTGDCSTGEGRVVVGQNSSAFFSDEADAECSGPIIRQEFDPGDCPGNGSGGDDDGDESDDDDNNESDDDDGSSTPSPPPSLDSANLSKSLTIPADTVELTVTGPVSAFAEESNASVTVAVRVGGETRRVLELNGKDGERKFGSTYIDERFENPTGGTVEVWIHKENLAGASLPYLDVETKRDSDGDGLTNELEKLGIKTGDGDRVYTDPYDADTDGDGISDGKEVADHIAHYVDGGYFELESDPTEVDSDGDGLDDYEETNEKRTVRYTKSSEDSKEFLAALYDDDSDPGNHLTSRTFRTDPMLADSDDDGLPDGKELELGTDPSRIDTDDDGIPDGDELDYDTDPTLHDYQGPEISILQAIFETTAIPPETTYRIGYSASDPSGVTRVQYVKEGETKIDSTFSDAPDGVSDTEDFTTGPIESIDSALGGTTVDVKATDGNDNTRQVVALERTNFYGEVADELGSDDIYGKETAATFGYLSGFSTGAGSTVETVRAVAENPFSFLDSITQVVTLLRNLGLLDDLIKAFPKQIEENQKRNNPYDEDTQEKLYTEYREAWYGGYISYALVSMVVGGQATKAAKNTKRFGNIVDTLDRNGRLTTASKYLDAVEDRTIGKGKRVTFKLGARVAKGSAHLSRKSGRRVLSGVKTASAKYDVRQKLGDAKVGTLAKVESYSPDTQRFIGRVTARLGDRGVKFVEEADSDDVSQMMDTRRTMADGGLSVGESRIWSYRLAELIGEDEISSEEFGRYLDNLEAMDHKTRQELVTLTLESDSASAKEAIQFTNDYNEISNEIGSTEELNDLYHRALTGDRGNFEGAAFEARYAASKSDDIIAVGRDTPGSIKQPRPGDIDVLTEEGGEKIGHELKSSSDEGEIGEIVKGYEELVEEGVVDDYKIVLKRAPSDGLKQYLETNNIDYEVYISGG
ncbi:hypothetical protein [Halorussus lipolyticus]|uniref:hypothetical protein n=1 Tax=Halorussus lipolyticus TaxID=3034024 RepID=UPI0023E8B05C|nr:hypothetical protein [Halorussus sp. DT80]